MKNLYLLSQSTNRGYDTYDSILVCAESEEQARSINPIGQVYGVDANSDWNNGYAWANNPSQVSCELIGTAADSLEIVVVLASFNAG